MSEFYEVFLGGTAVGKACLDRQGLYVHVSCRCHADQNQIFRLYAVLDDRRENIGVLVPEEDGIRLDRKIPAKNISGTGLRFEISTGTGTCRGEFVPICPEEPFSYIEELKNAFLETENGRQGIRIRKSPEAD